MDNPGSQYAVDSREVFTVMEQGMDQGAREIPRGGVNHHAGRFIDHDHGGILIEDREGEGFRYQDERGRGRKDSCDLISGPQLNAGFRRLSI
jgi:hypothetical protein